MKIKNKTLAAVLFGFFFFVGSSIALYRYVTDIYRPFDLSATENEKPQYSDTVKIGVVSRFTPEKIYEGYQPIMDYLTAKTGVLFELKLGSSYGETLRLLESGEALAAFLGSYIFAKENDGSLFAILKPLNENGEPYFRSALIVRENSPIFRVEDLKGKRVAVPSAEAFSGNWLQKILLAKFGLSVSDLKEIKRFDYHNSVARQVLMGNYDAGVVKDRVAREYANKGIRAVIYSEPIPGSPLVISAKSDKRKTEMLVRALLEAKPPEMKKWDEEFAFGFTNAENSDYAELRNLISGGEK